MQKVDSSHSTYDTTYGYKRGKVGKPSSEERKANAQELHAFFADTLRIVDTARADLSAYARLAVVYECPKVITNCLVSLSECYSKLDFLAKSKDINIDL